MELNSSGYPYSTIFPYSIFVAMELAPRVSQRHRPWKSSPRDWAATGKKLDWIGDDWGCNHPFDGFLNIKDWYKISLLGNPHFLWFSLSHSLSHYSPSVSGKPTNKRHPNWCWSSRWFSTPSCRTSAPIRLGGPWLVDELWENRGVS